MAQCSPPHMLDNYQKKNRPCYTCHSCLGFWKPLEQIQGIEITRALARSYEAVMGAMPSVYRAALMASVRTARTVLPRSDEGKGGDEHIVFVRAGWVGNKPTNGAQRHNGDRRSFQRGRRTVRARALRVGSGARPSASAVRRFGMQRGHTHPGRSERLQDLISQRLLRRGASQRGLRSRCSHR